MYQSLISVGKKLNPRYFIAAAARASQFSKIREEGLGYVCTSQWIIIFFEVATFFPTRVFASKIPYFWHTGVHYFNKAG